MTKLLDLAPVLRNYLIYLICAAQSTSLMAVILIALLKRSFNLALICEDYGLHFRLHRSYYLLYSFLDLLRELQELLGLTHNGLSLIKEPRMFILFKIYIK